MITTHKLKKQGEGKIQLNYYLQNDVLDILNNFEDGRGSLMIISASEGVEIEVKGR